MRLSTVAVMLAAAFSLIPIPAAGQAVEDPVENRWADYLPPVGSPASPEGFWRGVITRDGASQIVTPAGCSPNRGHSAP